MSLQVRKLDSSESDSFIELPFRVRESAYRMGLTPKQHMKALLQWGLANGSAFWLVELNGQPILRLSARACPHSSGTGTIGCFEADLKTSELIPALKLALSTAERWLKEKNVKEIVAPVDFNTWFNYRFSLPGKKFFPRFSWEPTSPPEYFELFRNEGFQNYGLYHSTFFPHFRIGDFCLGAGHLRRSYNAIFKHDFSLRPFDQENFLAKEVPVFHEISHEAFAEALLFEPIDLQTFTLLYAAAKQSYDSTPSCVLVAPDGETAGFLFAFFDGDYLVIKSVAIRKKYQGFKFGSGMIFHAAKLAFAKNKKGTISALVRSGISSEKISESSRKGTWFTWSHEYVLLKKDLK
jgi:hypothetical protein